MRNLKKSKIKFGVICRNSNWKFNLCNITFIKKKKKKKLPSMSEVELTS